MNGMMAEARSPASPGVEPVTYELRLYIAGGLPNSVQARENLQRLCETYLPGRYRLEVVDFFEHPGRAFEDGVLVTPTLVKLAPAPRSTVIGTLSNRDAVLRALGLPQVADE